MQVIGITNQRYVRLGIVMSVLAKEINHILISICWRVLQNCRIFRSAEFFVIDSRLVVATLKLCIRPF